jgi:hypothetical protein
MNTQILNGSPISFIKTDFVLTDEEKKYILNLNYLQEGSNKYKVSQDACILKKKELKRIEEIMSYWVNEYKDKILQIKNELRIVQSWSTINDNSNHHLHAHRNSFISCAFYVENEGFNQIHFRTGRSTLEDCHYLDYDIKEFNAFNAANWTFDIIQGGIFIFLSNLEHESINKGKKIMIGSNYFITGKFGTNKKFTYLEI